MGSLAGGMWGDQRVGCGETRQLDVGRLDGGMCGD